MSIAPVDHSATLRIATAASLRSTWLRPGALDAVLLSVARRGGRVVIALLLPVALLAIWSVAVRYELLAEQILPAPSLVWATAVDLVASGQLQSELAVSVLRVAAGLLIGGAAGLALGVATGLSRTVEAYVGPTMRAVLLVPSLGWLPFFMLAFGIGEALKVVMIAKACFLPMLVNSFDGVRNVPPKHYEVARMLELGRLDTLRFVVMPAILPSVLNGFRLSLSKGWQVLVLVEMIASAAGIGYLMTWGRKAFQLDVVLVTMLVIGATGWMLDRLALAVQARGTTWSSRSAR